MESATWKVSTGKREYAYLGRRSDRKRMSFVGDFIIESATYTSLPRVQRRDVAATTAGMIIHLLRGGRGGEKKIACSSNPWASNFEP